MKVSDLNYYYNKFKFGEDIFYQLMQKRVREILLVSTFYDAYIFEQDGQLSELIFGEYRQMNLTTAPRITSVPTAQEAVNMLKEKKFDLVITMMRIGEMTPFQLAKHIKTNYKDLPVLLLINNRADFAILENHSEEMCYVDNTFLWNGDTKLFLAMIKNIEDRLNLNNDTEIGLVRVILLVEDSIHYYSMYLPLLYGVVMRQTQRLITEELNEVNKRLRMRVRPKIILAKNYEEAIDLYNKYKEYLLCVISDIRFSKNNQIYAKAGFDLIEHIRSIQPDIPVIMQSSEIENQENAENMNCMFLDKNDENLLANVRNFFLNHLGFGNFVFRDKNQNVIFEAKSLIDFEKKVQVISDESLLFHSNSNHFSNWLIARGEIEIARKIKPITVDDFNNVNELRKYIKDTFKYIRTQRNRGKIINFEESSLSNINQIVRLSDGSLGGKGRGLAFLNALLCAMDLQEDFDGVDISLPSTAIIGTSEFDQFLETNNITKKVKHKTDDEINIIFLQGLLSDELINKLKIYLENVHYPLAVRSSSLLEDSQLQPFAGIYKTFMLPNNHDDVQVRLRQLTNAIKLVFASVFLKEARNYIEALSYKSEEEKMAVIIQEVVGSNYGDNYYYPHISGVAQSYNFYPTSYLEHSDGIANIALGLGISVVEGKYNYRFCPKYPETLMLTQDDMIKNSQKYFYALNLTQQEFDLCSGEEITLSTLEIKEAEKHNILGPLVSILDYESRTLLDGLPKIANQIPKGLRVLTFAGILKYKQFPLAEILDKLLEIGEISHGIPVEIEFAVSLNQNAEQKPTFFILQIRPLSVNPDSFYIDKQQLTKQDLLLYTNQAMGNGCIDNLYDIVFVKPDVFDKTKTEEIQQEIEYLNNLLANDFEINKKNGRNYILMGPGRWGTRDRFLGIPVKWNDINHAKVIIEYGLKDFNIDASQGTHFFHNLVAMNVGYFNIKHSSYQDKDVLDNFIDWEWINKQKKYIDLKYTGLIRLDKTFLVKMDGKNGIAVIQKPE
ncbi:MAG: PEP/pyruvate-binding domain-containing protein [Candidatus Cloacimonetes bacterium]|nr:hypothetical protein [Candidatus Cloacimonadota bacterium]MDD4155782.1 PEP/pyruvate-binding domain-containing protein [Candidatus Cloacimonadota bacterium]